MDSYEHSKVKVVGVVAAVLATGGIVAYLVGGLNEWLAGSLVGLAVIGVAATITFRGLMLHDASFFETVAALSITAMVACLASASLLSSIVPREPIVEGTLSIGERLDLPKSAHGPVRIAVRARPTNTVGAANVVVGVGDEHLEARVSSRAATARMGRRGRRKVIRDETTDWLSTNITSDVDSLELVDVDGDVAGAVRISVFDDIAPVYLQLLEGGLLMFLVVWMATRSGTRRAAIATGVALGFALAAHELVTPDIAVRREIGALLAGGVPGGLVGALIAMPFQRLAARRREARS